MTDEAGTEKQPQSAGKLHRMRTSHSEDLGRIDLHTLMIEMWRRLSRGDSPTETNAMLLTGHAIAELLTERSNVHHNRFSRKHLSDLFARFHRSIKPPKPPLAGAHYLELGCGSWNPCGFGMLMCLLGVQSWTSIDLDEVQDPGRAVRSLVRVAESLFSSPKRMVGNHPFTRGELEKHLEGFDLHALQDGEIAGLGDRLRYRRESAADLSCENASIDVVISNSFFEHVDDLDAVVAELARVTVTGGFGIHFIDTVDHMSYSNRVRHLDFLKTPAGGMVNNANRLRLHEYRALFERHGFEVQQQEPNRRTTVTAAEIAMFEAPWSTMSQEQLEVLDGTYVVRRF